MLKLFMIFGSFALVSTAMLSEWMPKVPVAYGITPMLQKNLLSHIASWIATAQAIYSNSMVDNAMQDCFLPN